MKLNRTATPTIVVLATVLVVSIASALTIRGSSGNGQDSNAANWMLQGRTVPLAYSANGKSATISRELVCIDQTVENAFSSPTLNLVGSCDVGGFPVAAHYMHLFQVKSTASNLTLKITGLSSFDYKTATNYGVLYCDDPSNSIEMCTNLTLSQVQALSITTTPAKTSVKFTVTGVFPNVPPGTTEQGQGLVFFVITNQAAPLPISIPKVGIG